MNPNHCRKIYSNGLDSYRLPAEPKTIKFKTSSSKVKAYPAAGLEELNDFLKAFFFAFKESKTHECFFLGKNLNKLSLSIDLYELKIYSLLGLFEF